MTILSESFYVETNEWMNSTNQWMESMVYLMVCLFRLTADYCCLCFPALGIELSWKYKNRLLKAVFLLYYSICSSLSRYRHRTAAVRRIYNGIIVLQYHSIPVIPTVGLAYCDVPTQRPPPFWEHRIGQLVLILVLIFFDHFVFFQILWVVGKKSGL